MQFEEKIVIPETLLVQEIDQELVLFDAESENYFGLDENGAVFWSVMEKESKLSSVYNALLSHYDVAPEILAQDLRSFVKDLENQGLIKVEPL